jgi:hypothetical protein
VSCALNFYISIRRNCVESFKEKDLKCFQNWAYWLQIPVYKKRGRDYIKKYTQFSLIYVYVLCAGKRKFRDGHSMFASILRVFPEN